jgi:mannose-1-phosphate guanylyltransferase
VSNFLERIYYDYDVTFGIKPKCAETGYGYIEADGEDLRSFMGKLDKPIILDGVDDLIIVQTEDARLIMRRGQSQKVRDVLNT